jgi:hypothetical protein
MADNKELVEVNGRMVRMNHAAFALAAKRFGALKQRTKTKEVPIELRKTAPKMDIIPAQTIPTPIEAKVDLTAKEVSITAPPVIEKVPEVKRPAGRKPVRK